MARGYIRIGSNGRIYSGVSFSLGGSRKSEPTPPGQYVFAFFFVIAVVIGGGNYFAYRNANSVAHRALQLVPENTMADRFKNQALREQAARESRPLLEVGDFVSWDDRVIRHGQPLPSN